MNRFLIIGIFWLGTQGCSYEEKSNASIESNEIVIEWNEMAYQLGYDHDQFYSFIGVRALAMTHIAIHDVLNAINPKYEQYAFKDTVPEADIIAAVSQTAYEILIDAYPGRKDTTSMLLKKWIDQVPGGKGKEKGIELGRMAAQAIIKLRKGDGHEKQGDYTPMTKPGDYQYTPGWNNWVLKPDFDYARPFTLDTVVQFRAYPPPKLVSETYTNSYYEVKLYGVKNSKARSADETQIAHWWAEFAEHGWNRIGRITAKKKKLNLMDAARMFALINMDIYDIYLASLESKYFYDTWRPYTAIRSTIDDGNPMTQTDTGWEPEMITPPWPEYPSAHAAVGAGGAEILTHVYGTPNVSFEMESISALPDYPTRAYSNLDSAAADCAKSRIMNGYHFRFATDAGMQQGRNIAKYIISNYLRPVASNN